jgi:hypothetical protein
MKSKRSSWVVVVVVVHCSLLLSIVLLFLHLESFMPISVGRSQINLGALC